MGNRTKAPPGRPKPQKTGPSLFFIIALGIGVLVLVILFIINTSKPQVPPTTTTSSSTGGRT